MSAIFEPVVIDTSNVKIRPLAQVTWQQMAAGILYEDSWHGRMWNIRGPEDVQRMHTNALAAVERKTGNPLVFLNPAEDEVLGVTNFMNCEPANRLIEIGGTWISKRWQRSCVNTETKFALLSYAFEQLKLVRVEFRIDCENYQSQRAIERLGVHFEGVIRNRRVIPSGETRDYRFYSVVDRDWPQVKDRIEGLIKARATKR